MGAPKGSSNGASYREAIMSEAHAKIQFELNSCRGRRWFSPTEVAAFLAPQVGVSVGRLMRNKRYRALIDEHVLQQPRLGVRAIDQSDQGKDTRIAALETENANLRREICRLTQAISNGSISDNRERLPSKTSQNHDNEDEFKPILMAFSNVLDEVGKIGIEVRAEGIFNRARRPGGDKIVDSKNIEDFIRYYLESSR